MKNDLRVTLTKRMLAEGLISCLQTTPLSRITVSELCREAGVNRTTFYNHYQSPAMVLRDITRGYAQDLREVYEKSLHGHPGDSTKAIEACLVFLDGKRPELQAMFSDNAENNVVRFEEELVDEIVSGRSDLGPWISPDPDDDDRLLYAIVSASASYGLIRAWITGAISKTPTELAQLVRKVFGEQVL